MNKKTYWNGEECQARKCVVVVADNGFFPEYWARRLVGQRVLAVEVKYYQQIHYLFNEDGSAWKKVTDGFGSAGIPHASIEIKEVVRYYDGHAYQ